MRRHATEAILGLFQWTCANGGWLQDATLQCMGLLFEATGTIPEIRTTFFSIVSKDGFFPNHLSNAEAVQFLLRMFSGFSEKQRRAFLKTLEFKYSLQVL